MHGFFKRQITLIGIMGLVLLGNGTALAVAVSDDNATVRAGIGSSWPDTKSAGLFARADVNDQDGLFELLNFPAPAKTVAPFAVGGDHFEARGLAKPGAEALPPAGKISDVSPVPLPAAVWSFLIGLMGVLGFKKRKRTADKVQ